MIHELTIELLRNYEELRALIRAKRLELETSPSEEKKEELEKYTKRKRSLERSLDELRGGVERCQFEVYYLHIVKGLSLSKTAKRVGYSKSGVCKIIKKINKKLGTDSGQGKH